MYVSRPIEDASSDHGVKRRRVSVACSICRARKSRCNGERPKCSSCAANGYECRYEQPVGANLVNGRGSTSSVNELEARVAELERLLQSARASEQLSERISPLQPSDGSQGLGPMGSLPNLTHEPRGENVDALASISLAASDEYDSGSSHFGDTSNITLIQQLTSQLLITEDNRLLARNLEAIGDQLPSRTPSDLAHASIYIPGPSPNTEVDPYCLPPVATTEPLIHVYFSAIHLFVPCLDERAFLKKYKACQNATRQSIESLNGAWLGSFYVMLSLACQCLEAKSPELNRAAESEMYYRKALNAGMKQAIYAVGFDVVQFLVLMTAYLQSTPRSTESWTFHSLAVKSALQISLYSKSSFARLPASEQVLRRKCWLCLIHNDRAMSIAFGRPGLVQKSYSICEFPPENLDELPPIYVTKGIAHLSNLHFRELIKLSTLVVDFAEELFHHGLDNTEKWSLSLVISKTVQALGKLSDWRSRLPASLRILDLNDLAEPKVSGNDLYSTRFRVFLSLRYLTSRILAYRALLDLYLKELDPTDNSADQTESLGIVTLAILEECSSNCRLVIDIAKSVVKVSGEGVNLNGAWWLSAHLVFNASLVLFGVNLAIQHCKSTPSQPRLSTTLIENRKAVDDATAVMQSLDRGNAVIGACRNVLLRFAKLYDNLAVSQPRQAATDFDELGLYASTLPQQNGFGNSEMAGGSSTGMGSLFDELAAYPPFNFFSDTSQFN